MTMTQQWWQGAWFYHIYPRSFSDSNGSGTGDLRGIINHLDYVASLGVDGIWISPFFTSPMKDFGYDVSDYRDIDPMFGTLQDCDDLLAAAHKRGLKIIIDLVLSHTSDQHPWFSDPAKKDYYVWADPKPDGSPPNNWVSVFGGSAWEWDAGHQQYYFHNFLTSQPDLNFHNPVVQDEVLDICRFWLDRGVDGFRLDVVNFYFHDQHLRDNPPRPQGMGFATQQEKETPYSTQQHLYDKSRPENLAFVEKLRAVVDTYPDRFLVGEIGDDAPIACAQEYTQGTARLHTAYNMQLLTGIEKDLTRDMIEAPVTAFFAAQTAMDDQWYSNWPSWAFSNHDVVRAASRWYKLYSHHPACSTMLNIMLGCLAGTIFMYQGEELGLPEAEIPFELLQDPWAKETWPEWQGRDGCRTPMPWSNDKNAGFSDADTLWLPMPETHNPLNVAAQQADPTSPLNITRAFITWRKTSAPLRVGQFDFIDTDDSKILHLTRTIEDKTVHCIFNLCDQDKTYQGQKFGAFGYHIDGFTPPR